MSPFFDMIRIYSYLLCLSVACAGVRAAAEAPSIAFAIPSAVAPGQTQEVTFHGTGLETPTAIWSTFGIKANFSGGAANRATYRITVPPDAPVGVGALRIATHAGVSNLHLFMVDDLPSIVKRGGNSSPVAAQTLTLPVGVDGSCEALRSDFYRFSAKRGQRVSVEIVAARTGSALDPVVRMLDASGREVAWADASPGAGGDCRFAHNFDADGQYLIELRDVGYDGGAAYRYRLRVGDFPMPVVSFPLGGRRGAAAMFTLLGEGCEIVPPIVLALPPDMRRVGLSAQRPGGAGSGFAAVVAGHLDETIESEPNDTPDTATPLAPPAAFSGRFEAPGDVDYFKLAMRKGEHFSVRARTRASGSPCDVAIRMLRTDGSTVGASKADAPGETSLDIAAPEEGVYHLRVDEITGAGGPTLAYRVELEPQRAGFALKVESDKFDVRPGGDLQLKVTAMRKGYDGPISLSLEGLDSASPEDTTIPGGKTEGVLKVKLPAGLPPGSIDVFRVIGGATIIGGEFRAPASTTAALRKLFPRMVYPPEELDGLIALGISDDRR